MRILLNLNNINGNLKLTLTVKKLTIPIHFIHQYFIKTQISIEIIDDENKLYKPYTFDIYNKTYLHDNPELSRVDAILL